jgi:hypothetical protein
MGLQIRTVVDGKQRYLDLYENEEVSIDVSFAEIQDITKRNSAFTQEFKIPGSYNNNDIFNYFFEINQVPLDWNPKRKFPASLIYNGYELFNGNIRLNMVTINIKEKVYSVTFYAQVGDLAANIGDKALCNVDTSSLNHSLYDYYTALSLYFDPSLHPTTLITSGSVMSNYINPVSNGDVQYILGQRGYDYTGNTYGTIQDINVLQTPVLDFSGVTGYFDYQGTPIIPPYLIPSIRTQKLYELIVNQAGYDIESYFFSTDYFKRYYLPLSFNTDSTYMAQSKPYDLLIQNISGTTNGGNILPIYVEGTTSTYTEYVIYSKKVVFDNLGFNPINVNNYPNDGNIYNTTGPVGLSACTDYVFAIPLGYATEQTLNVTFDYVWTGTPDPQGGSILGAQVKVWALRDALTNQMSGPLELQGYELGIKDVNVNIVQSPDAGTLTFTIPLCPLYHVFNQTGFFFVSINSFLFDLTIDNIRIKMERSEQCLPFTIQLNKEMDCTKKQVEFIQDVNRMFNLVVVPHPIKPKTLIIEPLVDWIGKGEQLDWTEKVDYNSPQTLSPTTSIINGSIFVANKLDKDFVNTQYNTKSNKIFGQNIIDLGVDYKNETMDLTQRLGQNTDYYLNASGSTGIAIPCYFITKENNKQGQVIFEYRPFRSLPRMVFKSVPLASGNTKQNGYFLRFQEQTYPSCKGHFEEYGVYQVNDMQNINRLTTYPYAISGFSHYTTYDSSNVFTSDELVYSDLETQYDRYYRDYVDDLTAEDNKIYTCKMYLTPWEVSQLYSNEVIFIKNAKFRINKITNLNLIDPDLCDVELVKLTRYYTPTPVLFYDLIDCENSCNIIHSNTDENYLLWAFENQYVKLVSQFTNDPIHRTVGKKYKVIRTEYNQDYNYQNVYFDFQVRDIDLGFPRFKYVYDDYLTYDSCSASTPNYKLNIFNDLTGQTNNCVKMNVQNTGTTTSTFTYTDCYGGAQTHTLTPSSSFNICGLYKSFNGDKFKFCPDIVDSGDCGIPLPPATNTLDWYFTADIGSFDANLTSPKFELIQTANNTDLINVNSFSTGAINFSAGYLEIIAGFTYQNIAGSINDIAIVAGVVAGDDSLGRVQIPSPTNGTYYSLNVTHYFPTSGSLFVTVIQY